MKHDHELRLHDWFCGAGGSTQGAAAVPGVRPAHAANHWERAIESHAANFPETDHWRGNIRDLDVSRLPYAELFWASPECTNWSRARGQSQDYAVTDTALPGMEDPTPSEEVERSRALMEEVPMYLRAMALRGRPVLAGVVENVVDIHDWVDHGRWRAEIEAVGYRTRLIALNSMHAQARRTPRAPQSRDRYYLAYWHVSLGRDPDWDKWLRPAAWCPTCDEMVAAVQVFKTPGREMGRYRSQYVYRCPRVACRNRVVEPEYAPAYTAIDWSIPGKRIGDRAKPLAGKTMARIEAGIKRFARPIHIEATGHTYDAADPTQSTRSETAIVAVPPLLVPAGGTWNDDASPVGQVMRARTTRENEALVTVPPFFAELRGGGSVARLASEALATVTASGNHHGLVVPDAAGDAWSMWAALYAYDAGVRDITRPLPTQTTLEGDALLTGVLPSVDDCLFRMLEPHEILAGMAFFRDYVVLGNRRERVRQAGNAVTPPAAEVIVSALVECITGEALEAAA
jgi:DNA (cytosine-5)-methyltransferase 1